MRRLLTLITFVVLLLPSAAVAQEATPRTASAQVSITNLLPVAADIGENWRVVSAIHETSDDTGFPLAGRRYMGPYGSRLSIVIYELPMPISKRSEAWTSIQGIWQNWADYLNNPGALADDREHVSPVSTSNYALPAGVNDALRFGGNQPNWGIRTAVGLYAFNAGPAALVILEGAVNDIESIDAIDLIAELIAAKAAD